MINDSEAAIHRRIIGAWRLVECLEIGPDGSKHHPLGQDAVGQVVYTADGHMSAQLMQKGRPRFSSDDYRRANLDEASSAFMLYFGYFGTYKLDLATGTVIHLIEGAWFPNLEGSRQVRSFRFEGDYLILDAETAWGMIRNVWQRDSEASSTNG